MVHTLIDTNTVAARYWHRVDEQTIQCDLCPRFCRLKEGQRGLCFVRQMREGQLVLTTYGRSSGFCIDPIEKKPLNHFLPGSSVLSFGTAGCNLTCKFCQNWDISKSRQMDRLADQASPQQLAQAATDSGCRSLAYTYNDPVIFLEYAVDVAQACHEQQVRNVAVSAGYIAEPAAEEFFRYMDAANIDLKAFNDDFYYKLCGAHLQPVLDTLCYLKHETDVWLELTTLLIPGENDSEAELEQMTQWIAENLGVDVPLHFTAFHPDWKMKDRDKTPADSLFRARRIALKNGMHYVYTGNIMDDHGGSTWCPACDQRLIHRDWHQIRAHHISEQGQCLSCHHQLAGVFDGVPGNFGRRRIPVLMQKP